MKEDEASATAFTVVQGILLTCRSPVLGQLVTPDDEAACRRIMEASVEGRRRLKQLASPLYRAMARMAERVMVPGITLHYVLRKRFIEDEVRAAIADGATQFVNIGAGFDMLAYRLATEQPDVTFIEIDHPATARVKRAALVEKMPNMHLLAEDLSRHAVAAVLTGCDAFSADRQTVFVCEGVLMHLDEGTIAALFEAIKALTGAGTRFVFTALAPVGSPEDNTSLLLRAYLKGKSEPLLWTLRPGDMEAFVTQQGYMLRELSEDSALLATYLHEPYAGTLHRGEYLVSVAAA